MILDETDINRLDEQRQKSGKTVELREVVGMVSKSIWVAHLENVSSWFPLFSSKDALIWQSHELSFTWSPDVEETTQLQPPERVLYWFLRVIVHHMGTESHRATKSVVEVSNLQSGRLPVQPSELSIHSH